MKIGFTGTRKGMTPAQTASLQTFIVANRGAFTEFHHGDCKGADAEAHRVAERFGIEPVIHPPKISTSRAYCKAKRILKPLEFLDRNKAIVDDTDLLLVAPAQFSQILRSGTWSTFRYAERIGRQTIMFLPDGRTV